jgi:uncharacterized protein
MDDSDLLKIFSKADELCEHGDYAGGIKLHKKAARFNYTPSLLNLGYIYDTIEEFCDEKKAKYYYKRTYQFGDPAGAINLSILYKQKGKIFLSKKWRDKSTRLRRAKRTYKSP